MASPSNDPHDQRHLVSLVLESKKALQQGEALCSRANTLSNTSANDAFDVFALNAKIRWVSDAVLEQLKLAACVAKDIEERQAKVEEQARAWDTARERQVAGLDAILNAIGAELVPPSFHEPDTDLSLFGSQSSDSADEVPNAAESSGRSPSLTIRGSHSKQKKRERKAEERQQDRTRWKTLRDFVDEQTIEASLEALDEDRNELENALSATAAYPHTLRQTLDKIRAGLAPRDPPVDVMKTLRSQESVSNTMAQQLESLAGHYDQMETALGDSEAGHIFEDDDLMEMNRDTEELPVIIGELEDAYMSIQFGHDELQTAKRVSFEYLDKQRGTLDDLDELGDIMDEMLQRQSQIEAEIEERLADLNQRLLDFGELTHKYTLYQHSFRRLLVEVARRRDYREKAEQIVRGMMAQLDALTEEECHTRGNFNDEHGQHLPLDICSFIQNSPTRYEVVPIGGSDAATEFLPDVPADMLPQAKGATVYEDTKPFAGTESL